MPTAEQLPLAKEYKAYHDAGRDDLIPYTAMELTTVVAEAARMLLLENGPEYFEIPISTLAVGNVALVGIPGGPFNGIGIGLKEAEGWDVVLPCCLVNGCESYFPMQEAYDEGGYEAGNSNHYYNPLL